jgi:hypothetical protein
MTNIVVHIRRGDVTAAGFQAELRFVTISYFVNVLKQLMDILDRSLAAVHIVSQGERKDFAELLNDFPSATLILNGAPVDVVRNVMMHADVLVTSPSGFSHLPAELGDAVVVAIPFWHVYANSIRRTVFVDKTHRFSEHLFKKVFCASRRCTPCIDLVADTPPRTRLGQCDF